jgi:hypothetical protein
MSISEGVLMDSLSYIGPWVCRGITNSPDPAYKVSAIPSLFAHPRQIMTNMNNQHTHTPIALFTCLTHTFVIHIQHLFRITANPINKANQTYTRTHNYTHTHTHTTTQTHTRTHSYTSSAPVHSSGCPSAQTSLQPSLQ